MMFGVTVHLGVSNFFMNEANVSRSVSFFTIMFIEAEINITNVKVFTLRVVA